VSIEELKYAKDRLEAEEAVEEQAIQEGKGSEEASSGSDGPKSSSLKSVNGHLNSEKVDDNEEAIEDDVPSPIQERTGRDITFGNLPNPRKIHERHDSDAIQPAQDEREEGLGKRTITIDSQAPPPRDPNHPRLRRATSTGFPKTATFERVLSQAFRRRRRDGSPNSRRSSATHMTLPYFSFQPTIGRNSVMFVKKTGLILVIRRVDRGTTRRIRWSRIPCRQDSVVDPFE
jgi:hypothetical protein